MNINSFQKIEKNLKLYGNFLHLVHFKRTKINKATKNNMIFSRYIFIYIFIYIFDNKEQKLPFYPL